MKTCPTRLSDEFLAGSLSAEEESKFAAHLESCPHCLALLESKSASESEWKIAREMLSYAPTKQFTVLKLDEDGSVLTDCDKFDVEEQIQDDGLHFISSFLAPSDDPAMLGRIGTYEIMGLLGRGGTGIVLKAYDRSLNRNIAIKVLDPAAANIGAARDRFAREARAMAAITHEHVVPVYGVDEHQRLPYFVMEYVAGGSLDRRITTDGPFDVISIVRIGLQTAQALAAAHEQGLVHRDIKPGNILIDKGTDRVRVADFGLARVANEVSCTRSGFVAGTPQYMAPEQVRAEACDARSDLFSLGAVMYAMSTGHPPFRAETVYAVMQRIVHDAPRSIREQNAQIPAWLEQFVMRLLHKEKDQRFVSASEVGALLQDELAYLQNPTTAIRPIRAWFSESKNGARKSRQKKWTIAIAACAALFLLSMIFMNSYANHEPTTPFEKSNSAMTKAGEISKVGTNDSSSIEKLSTVPLWNNDKIGELKDFANQLESQMYNEKYGSSVDEDSWPTQTEQMRQQTQQLESNSPFPALPTRTNSNTNATPNQ
jgi:serine/threonine-protein kinase